MDGLPAFFQTAPIRPSLMVKYLRQKASIPALFKEWGPPAFVIVASDLRTIHNSNALDKFADDTYLIIPSSNLHTTDEELLHVED